MTPFPIRRLGRFWPPLLIALAAVAAYANSFSGPFVLDDPGSILENPTLRHLWPIGPVLSPPSNVTVSGRPLLNLSFALNYALGGTRVWGYHALNLSIHILAGLTLFGITRRTLQNVARARRSPPEGEGGPDSAGRLDTFPTTLAFAVALLWTLHPLQTESVTYIVQRAESLMGLFYLLTLYCFIRSVDADGEAFAPGWAVLSFLACLLGMATKEVMVSAPVIVFLYDRTFVAGSFREAWRRRRSLYLGLASTWVLLGYLVIGGGGGRSGSIGFGVNISWWSYGLTQFEAIARYLRLTFWPHPLVFEYGLFWVKDAAQVVPYACVVVPLVLATGWALLRPPAKSGGFGGRALGFAGAWFFAILAPTSLVPGTTQMIVEHRMYLALAPVLAVVIWPFFVLWPRAAAAHGVGLIVLAGLCGVLTARRNADYRSETGLWADTVAKRPENALAHNSLGVALEKMPGHLTDAIAEFSEALRLRPIYAEADGNRADADIKEGAYDRAIADCDEAIRLKPSYAEAYSIRAFAEVKKGDYARAIADSNEAIRLKPSYAGTYGNRALADIKMGAYDRAIADCDEAIRLNPSYPEAYSNRAFAYAQKGDYTRAIADCDEAVRLNPNYAEAYGNRAFAEIRKGDYDRTLADCNEAIRLDPNDAEAYSNRADAYAQKGDFARAISDDNDAIRLDPTLAGAYNNAAWLLAACSQARIRNGPKAEAYARKACELTEWKEGDDIDTLAAACAEAGHFAEAVKWETQFIASSSSKEAADSARQRLGLYTLKKAYHEEPLNRSQH